MEVWKEIAKLEVRVNTLAHCLYQYKAEENDGFVKEATKAVVERQIAAIYLCLHSLSNQFSVANINDHLERMMKESEGGGDKQ